MVMKSGTNDFHGSVQWVRHTAFADASNYFNKVNGCAHDPGTPNPCDATPIRNQQFGGTFGGPIVRNKTFFFGTYSGLRQVTSNFFNGAVVPTALERTGDFSQSKVKPTNPLTGAAYQDNKIPITSFDPTALNILNKYIPLAMRNSISDLPRTRVSTMTSISTIS